MMQQPCPVSIGRGVVVAREFGLLLLLLWLLRLWWWAVAVLVMLLLLWLDVGVAFRLLCLSAVVAVPFSWFVLGLTDTLTGVGCVLKTGIWQSCSVRESGDKNPFPIQIRRKSSPSSQFGTSVRQIRVTLQWKQWQESETQKLLQFLWDF